LFKGSLSDDSVELLDGLRLLSAELEKSRKTLPEVLSLARLNSKLQQLGVDMENIEHFISSCMHALKMGFAID